MNISSKIQEQSPSLCNVHIHRSSNRSLILQLKGIVQDMVLPAEIWLWIKVVCDSELYSE